MVALQMQTHLFLVEHLAWAFYIAVCTTVSAKRAELRSNPFTSLLRFRRCTSHETLALQIIIYRSPASINSCAVGVYNCGGLLL
ncbi:hypothetical protein HOY82DRAFT_562815 [Tuber indicum]|nr:hypothetical protein HOY82DRAFT_562815 [Tuber indicum]